VPTDALVYYQHQTTTCVTPVSKSNTELTCRSAIQLPRLAADDTSTERWLRQVDSVDHSRGAE
jgi:hypothetical protein